MLVSPLSTWHRERPAGDRGEGHDLCVLVVEASLPPQRCFPLKCPQSTHHKFPRGGHPLVGVEGRGREALTVEGAAWFGLWLVGVSEKIPGWGGGRGLAEGAVCAETQWEKEVGGSFGAGEGVPVCGAWADFRGDGNVI